MSFINRERRLAIAATDADTAESAALRARLTTSETLLAELARTLLPMVRFRFALDADTTESAALRARLTTSETLLAELARTLLPMVRFRFALDADTTESADRKSV